MNKTVLALIITVVMIALTLAIVSVVPDEYGNYIALSFGVCYGKLLAKHCFSKDQEA